MCEIPSIVTNNLSKSQRKKVCNIGINDSEYLTTYIVNNKTITCPYYQVWVNMLRRCYSAQSLLKRPTYIGCSVCDKWLLFSNFKLWMEKQDWVGKQLDKDLLIKGNKTYSPNTCLFVTSEINNILLNSEVSNSSNFIGMTWDNRRSRYLVRCNVSNKNVHLGHVKTQELASNLYNSFKKKHIIEVASTQNDTQLKEALIRIASQY